MITNPVDGVRVYDTINALLVGKAIPRKEKHRLKKKAGEKC